MGSSVAAITALFAVSLWGVASASETTGLARSLAIGLGVLGALLHLLGVIANASLAPVIAVELAICFVAGRIAFAMPSRTLGYLVVATLVGVAVMVHWQFGREMPRRNRSGQLTACRSNLKNLGTAQEMYSTDWSGKYASQLERLTPNYLKTLPECPAAGSVTYRLQTGLEAPMNIDKYEDFFQFECGGENHKAVGVPPDRPAYDSVRGPEDGRDHRYEWYHSG